MPSRSAYRLDLTRSSSDVMVPSGKMRSQSGLRLFSPSRAECSPSSLLFSESDFACWPRSVSALVRFARSAAHERFRKMNLKNLFFVSEMRSDIWATDHSPPDDRDLLQARFQQDDDPC